MRAIDERGYKEGIRENGERKDGEKKCKEQGGEKRKSGAWMENTEN